MFFFIELKHISVGEPFDITFHSTIESFGFDLVKGGKVKIEHHALAADFVNFALDRREFFHWVG